jgi:hypothetical protein
MAGLVPAIHAAVQTTRDPLSRCGAVIASEAKQSSYRVIERPRVEPQSQPGTRRLTPRLDGFVATLLAMTTRSMGVLQLRHGVPTWTAGTSSTSSEPGHDGDQASARMCPINPAVEASNFSVLAAGSLTTGARCDASSLPSSTPHWSNGLMFQIAASVNTLCS